MPRIKEMVYENRITYAQKHGLDFMWANMTSYNLPDGAPIYWNKIPILRDAFDRFPEAEWIWWLDIDIIIMNMSLHIHDHVLSPEGMARNILLDYPINGAEGGSTGYRTSPGYRHKDVNFVISLDHWGMNVGNFLMRRSEWSDWLLDMWLEPLYISQNWVFPENDGWSHLWQHHQIVRNHTACMNQHSMNAYPDYNALGSHWEAGDHVVHFAGCGGDPICEGAWAKYWNMREDAEVPAFVQDKLREGVAEIEAFQGGAK
ncbi:Alpha-1,2-galactosyltransferase [Penicillium ucsense]|uniref:Alpha-1,2-galactosyltransferase n=1 Tax=Penicillium ucsense TaxID=2839758 RepID=A0A8J8W4X3_9EURO|nr:Alpha-1,2-galactosyltransferase [Penicillium ucsense]KAF7737715.1 Alpha-1,2-galactosyltransferase [Penicillium ucsense]